MQPVSHTNLDLLWSWNALWELSDIVEVSRYVSLSRSSHLVIGIRWSNILHVLLNYQISIIKVQFACNHSVCIFSLFQTQKLLLVNLEIDTLIIVILLLDLFAWITWVLNAYLILGIKWLSWRQVYRKFCLIVIKGSKTVDYPCQVLVAFLEHVDSICQPIDLGVKILLLLHPLLFFIDVQFDPLFPVIFITSGLSLSIITFLSPMENE